MTLTAAFSDTAVAFEKSMSAIERMLDAHGVRESRYTHLRPQRPPKNEWDSDDPALIGRIVYEFVRHGATTEERRGVRVSVAYQPAITPRGAVRGTTPEMAARALFWFLKAKFDGIDYGIEEFDVAFMPHLVTALGQTFAESPGLIADVVARPESVATLMLPPGGH